MIRSGILSQSGFLSSPGFLNAVGKLRYSAKCARPEGRTARGGTRTPLVGPHLLAPFYHSK